MKYIHGIVATNRPDLLRLAVASVEPLWSHVFILDNSEDGKLGTEHSWPVPVVRPSVPLTCGQSMNYLYRLAKEHGCDAFGYQHHDARFENERDCNRYADALQQQINSGVRWCALLTNYDIISAYNLKAIEDIGLWDTTFPNSNYHIDIDWFYRARLKLWAPVHSFVRPEHMNGGSQSIRSDNRRQFLHDVLFRMNLSYYEQKWGDAHEHERFVEPWQGRLPG